MESEFKLPSYGYKRCCMGSECYKLYSNSEKDPCWGEISAIDEQTVGDDDYYWIHSCEGHADQYDDSKAEYRKSNLEMDRIQ